MEPLCGIFLLNFIYKLFTNVLDKYIEPYAENFSANSSAAFVKTDQNRPYI